MNRNSPDGGSGPVLPDPQSPAHKTDQVREMFDAVAPRYDAVNRLISLRMDTRWRRRCIQIIRSLSGPVVAALDVASGTGDMAMVLLKAVPSAEVVAFDLSADMLRIAERRIADEGLDGASFVQGDIECTDFADGIFDLVTCVFGVRNFSDVPRGLGEMRRLTRPAGTCLILETSRPANWGLRTGHALYCRAVVPLLGRLFSSSAQAYSYLARSVESFPSGEAFVALMLQAGFVDVRAVPFSGGVVTAYVASAPTVMRGA